MSDFEEAIRLDARNAEAYAGRGLIRARMGEHSAALADANRASRLGSPGMARLHWNIAHIYAQLVRDLDVNRPNERDGALRTTYANQALDMLKKSLNAIPEAERFTFWSKHIQNDGWLKPLEGITGYEELRRLYEK